MDFSENLFEKNLQPLHVILSALLIQSDKIATLARKSQLLEALQTTVNKQRSERKFLSKHWRATSVDLDEVEVNHGEPN